MKPETRRRSTTKKHIVEGDGAQVAVADDLGEPVEDMGDRQVVEMADHDLLRL